MEELGMYEGFSHMANIFLTCEGVESAGNLQEEIWQILQSEEGCEGGVSLTASGDLAVRILGSRAQKLQETAEKIKKCWESK